MLKNQLFEEKKPLFKVVGNEFLFNPDEMRVKYKGLSAKNRKRIIIGKLIFGEMQKGDPINLVFLEETILCRVVSIQREKKYIDYAVTNESIGISISGIKMRQIRKLNNQIWNLVDEDLLVLN